MTSYGADTGKRKVNLPLHLTKHHAIKKLTPHYGSEWSVHAPAALPPLQIGYETNEPVLT